METRICKVCGEEKELTEKLWKPEPRCIGGFYPRCRKCQSRINSKRQTIKYRENPEWRESIIKSTGKYYREKFDGDAEYREHKRDRGAENWKRKKLEVLHHYSAGLMVCGCCEESNTEFLAIDHINGGGGRHRAELKIKAGLHFYNWLIKNNFPDGYRVLCHNCNSSLGYYGYCPHETMELAGTLKRIKPSS